MNNNINRTNSQRHNLGMEESNDESEHKDDNIEDDDKEDMRHNYLLDIIETC